MKEENKLIMKKKNSEKNCSQILMEDKNNQTDTQISHNIVPSILLESHIKRTKNNRKTAEKQRNKSNLEGKSHSSRHLSEIEISKFEERQQYHHTSLQNTWREIRESLKQCQTLKNFESRKEDFMEVVDSVQQQLENIDQKRSNTHRKKNEKRYNNEQKLFLEELNVVQRVMDFLFDHNEDLLGLLLYKTKYGQVRSRIARLSFYYSWFCYAKNTGDNQIQNDMIRWFFCGIVDAHILALSNCEHPNTTQYKEMLIDVSLRERSVFDHKLYPTPK